MSSFSNQIYEFDEFRLDAREKALWCGGKLVPLTPKLVETLLVLVERDGHIVDKQELMERVWPDTFVEEGNIARHVSLLRKTLGEWTDNAALIETLPRRGYRFSVPVRQLAVPGEDRTSSAPPNPELLIETHTITRITAEEEEDSPPSLSPVTALEPVKKPWPRKWVIGVLALVVIAVGVFFYLSRRSAILTEKDTLLLAEFVNRTGDPVFDGTLRQGLAVQLEQSPFLTFLSDQRVRETLKLMTRSPEEPLTTEVGREICVRQGVKALIRGEIAPLGSHYVITLEAIAGATGDSLARAQSEAATKEQVLQSLSRAASDLRARLGESLSSLQRFDALLETTTSSLPALQNLTQAMALNQQGKPQEALPYLQRAVELDPNFANAWATRAAILMNAQQQSEAVKSAARAYALRDRASELERFRIDVWYHVIATRDKEKALEIVEQFRNVYPRYPMAQNTLSRAYLEVGQFALAEAPAREALRLNPASNILYKNLAQILLLLNRREESRAVLQQLSERGPLLLDAREILYLIACLEEDGAAQQREIEQLKGKPDEHLAWGWQAQRALAHGQVQQAEDALQQMKRLATRPQLRGEIARRLADFATNYALLFVGSSAPAPREVSALIEEALALERNEVVLTQVSLALALVGNTAEAQALGTEFQQLFPQGTFINLVHLPVLRAAAALRAGQPAEALEQLRPAERYEATAQFLPQYLRGLAYLQLRQGREAAAEFEKILTHRSYAPLSPLFPLAHLGRARATALQGDASKSRQAYAEFFKLWQEADGKLPILSAAQQEAAALK